MDLDSKQGDSSDDIDFNVDFDDNKLPNNNMICIDETLILILKDVFSQLGDKYLTLLSRFHQSNVSFLQ